MRTIVHADPFSMITALEKLDLSVPILHRAVESGYLAKANATPNHPPLYPSFVAWGDTICSLRNELIPRGWSKTNERNWPRVIHPSGEIALTVATGNEHTGSPNFMPATKSTKGPSTIQAIEINRNQGWLPGFEPELDALEKLDDEQPVTWILLGHFAQNEIRCELSLPISSNEEGRVVLWGERILLPSVPLDPEIVDIIPPQIPDIDVQITRKL